MVFMTMKLLVVEDHALVREGLVQILQQLAAHVEVFGVAHFDAACDLLGQHSIDLAVLDLGLPGVDGLSCLRSFRQRYPAMPVVILSAYDDVNTVAKALECGAAGFASKAYSSDQLLDVLRAALDGKITKPDHASYDSTIVPAPVAGASVEPTELGLTARQAEVLGLMASGKSNRDIASLLGLSEGTVKIHLTTIFKVLGVSSRTQAMVSIAQLGIRL